MAGAPSLTNGHSIRASREAYNESYTHPPKQNDNQTKTSKTKVSNPFLIVDQNDCYTGEQTIALCPFGYLRDGPLQYGHVSDTEGAAMFDAAWPSVEGVLSVLSCFAGGSSVEMVE